jgi:hypothetical protein
LNFAIGVLYPIEPYGFVLDSPTFSTVSTVCLREASSQGTPAVNLNKTSLHKISFSTK